MNELSGILKDTLESMASRDNRKPNDYEKNGILRCGKCHEPKQAWIDWIPDAEGKREKKLVPCMCQCDEIAEKIQKAKDEALQFKQRLNNIREAIAGTQQQFTDNTFDKDDNPKSPISNTCRLWVKRWDEMKANNMGILFFGNKGVGKSFYAACIANALADKQILTAFTTTANLMNILATWDKASTIDAICRVPLLVLDDLGAERDTTYSAELMYTVIDARSRAKKPTIVTTNLDLADMQAETDLWRSRIYDRVIEMCPIPLRMEGESKRKAIADERKQKAKELLRQAMKDIAYGD